MDNFIAGTEAGVSYAFEGAEEFLKAPEEHAESEETYVAFGRNVDISISRNQNKERAYSVGDRNAEATVTKNFSGSATINGTMSNAYWLLGVLGKVTDGGSVGAYTHTYTEENRQPTITIKRVMSFGDTEGTETLIGGVINSCTITSAVNEAVRFSLEVPYRYEADPDETTEIAYVVDSEDIFTFAGAKIEAPSGEELVGIENFEIAFNNNAEMSYGLSSRYAEAVVSKNREYNVSYTAKIKDYIQLKAFLSTSEIATLRMEFVNGSGDNLELNFAEFHMNEDTLPTNPTEIIKEDCSGWAHSCTSAVYTNSTETAPAEEE
jgi:hypothetical protein